MEGVLADESGPSGSGPVVVKTVEMELRNPPPILKKFASHPHYDLLKSVIIALYSMFEETRQVVLPDERDATSAAAMLSVERQEAELEADLSVSIDEYASLNCFQIGFAGYYGRTRLKDLSFLEEINARAHVEIVRDMSYIHHFAGSTTTLVVYVYPKADATHAKWTTLSSKLADDRKFQEILEEWRALPNEFTQKLAPSLALVQSKEDVQVVTCVYYLLHRCFTNGFEFAIANDRDFYYLEFKRINQRFTWRVLQMILGLNQIFLWRPIIDDKIEIVHPPVLPPQLNIAVCRRSAVEMSCKYMTHEKLLASAAKYAPSNSSRTHVKKTVLVNTFDTVDMPAKRQRVSSAVAKPISAGSEATSKSPSYPLPNNAPPTNMHACSHTRRFLPASAERSLCRGRAHAQPQAHPRTLLVVSTCIPECSSLIQLLHQS